MNIKIKIIKKWKFIWLVKSSLMFFSLLFYLSIWYWSNQVPYDCMIATEPKDKFLERFQDLNNNMLEEDEISLAYDHLQSYCCEKQFIWWNSCWSVLPPNYPESPFFYDHIIDIWFRKLDWNEDLLYSQINIDDTWKEWREFIKEMAEKEESYPPEVIKLKFEQIWKVWQTNWLHRKYQMVCLDAENIEKKLFSTSTDKITLLDLQRACKNHVHNRLSREVQYVQSLLLTRWNLLLQDNLDNYIDKYFARNRAMDYLERLAMFEWLLMQVTKKVNEWTWNCSPG